MIIALLGGPVFLLVVNGPLIEVYGSTVAVMILTSATSLIFIITCFVVAPMGGREKR